MSQFDLRFFFQGHDGTIGHKASFRCQVSSSAPSQSWLAQVMHQLCLSRKGWEKVVKKFAQIQDELVESGMSRHVWSALQIPNEEEKRDAACRTRNTDASRWNQS